MEQLITSSSIKTSDQDCLSHHSREAPVLCCSLSYILGLGLELGLAFGCCALKRHQMYHLYGFSSVITT